MEISARKSTQERRRLREQGAAAEAVRLAAAAAAADAADAAAAAAADAAAAAAAADAAPQKNFPPPLPPAPPTTMITFKLFDVGDLNFDQTFFTEEHKCDFKKYKHTTIKIPKNKLREFNIYDRVVANVLKARGGDTDEIPPFNLYIFDPTTDSLNLFRKQINDLSVLDSLSEKALAETEIIFVVGRYRTFNADQVTDIRGHLAFFCDLTVADANFHMAESEKGTHWRKIGSKYGGRYIQSHYHKRKSRRHVSNKKYSVGRSRRSRKMK
jgi:hypothetical protein